MGEWETLASVLAFYCHQDSNLPVGKHFKCFYCLLKHWSYCGPRGCVLTILNSTKAWQSVTQMLNTWVCHSLTAFLFCCFLYFWSLTRSIPLSSLIDLFSVLNVSAYREPNYFQNFNCYFCGYFLTFQFNFIFPNSKLIHWPITYLGCVC